MRILRVSLAFLCFIQSAFADFRLDRNSDGRVDSFTFSNSRGVTGQLVDINHDARWDQWNLQRGDMHVSAMLRGNEIVALKTQRAFGKYIVSLAWDRTQKRAIRWSARPRILVFQDNEEEWSLGGSAGGPFSESNELRNQKCLQECFQCFSENIVRLTRGNLSPSDQSCSGKTEEIKDALHTVLTEPQCIFNASKESQRYGLIMAVEILRNKLVQKKSFIKCGDVPLGKSALADPYNLEMTIAPWKSIEDLRQRVLHEILHMAVGQACFSNLKDQYSSETRCSDSILQEEYVDNELKNAINNKCLPPTGQAVEIAIRKQGLISGFDMLKSSQGTTRAMYGIQSQGTMAATIAAVESTPPTQQPSGKIIASGTTEVPSTKQLFEYRANGSEMTRATFGEVVSEGVSESTNNLMAAVDNVWKDTASFVTEQVIPTAEAKERSASSAPVRQADTSNRNDSSSEPNVTNYLTQGSSAGRRSLSLTRDGDENVPKVSPSQMPSSDSIDQSDAKKVTEYLTDRASRSTLTDTSRRAANEKQDGKPPQPMQPANKQLGQGKGENRINGAMPQGDTEPSQGTPAANLQRPAAAATKAITPNLGAAQQTQASIPRSKVISRDLSPQQNTLIVDLLNAEDRSAVQRIPVEDLRKNIGSKQFETWLAESGIYIVDVDPPQGPSSRGLASPTGSAKHQQECGASYKEAVKRFMIRDGKLTIIKVGR